MLSRFSHVHLFVALWTVAHQVPLPMWILQARILQWVAVPPSGDFPHPGIKPMSPALASGFFTPAPPGKHLPLVSLHWFHEPVYAFPQDTGPISSPLKMTTSDVEYIMRNARLDELQAGIRIAGRNLSNLRYADDATLMAETKGNKKLLEVKESG